MEWTCQTCGWKNAGKWEKCAKCGYSKDPSPEDVVRLTIAKQRAADFVVTTTSILDGLKITKYHGIVTAVIALGTGFLSDFGAGLADLAGGRASGYQEKIDQATRAVMSELTSKALRRNPEINGLIGLQLDYQVANNNMMILVGTATAIEYSK